MNGNMNIPVSEIEMTLMLGHTESGTKLNIENSANLFHNAPIVYSSISADLRKYKDRFVGHILGTPIGSNIVIGYVKDSWFDKENERIIGKVLIYSGYEGRTIFDNWEGDFEVDDNGEWTPTSIDAIILSSEKEEG